jgi:hypothetical protein
METLKDILWPVVVVGGLGAFIDFLIGKTGQEKAKDFLLRWWVRFDDVRWKNFGREEGLFAGRLIEQWFGRRICSFRRIAMFSFLSIMFGSLDYVWLMLSFPRLDEICAYCVGGDIKIVGALLIICFIGFSLSISFTRYITFQMAHLCGEGSGRNLLVFVSMLIINYLMLTLFFPIVVLIRDVMSVTVIYVLLDTSEPLARRLGWLIHYIIDAIKQGANHLLKPNVFYPIAITHIYAKKRPIDEFSIAALLLFPSLLRFFLSIIFVGSFLLKPLVMRPLSLVWARIVESEKPVFTVIFGGAAALATAISEAAKHL